VSAAVETVDVSPFLNTEHLFSSGRPRVAGRHDQIDVVPQSPVARELIRFTVVVGTGLPQDHLVVVN
jgi:hypothetical protein